MIKKSSLLEFVLRASKSMKQTLTGLEKYTETQNSERLQYALSIIERTFRQSSVNRP